MATMQQSQRFDFRAANFADIETSLDEIGHVVLDGLWNVSFLNDLLTRTRAHFANHYEMSITSLEMLSPELDAAFFVEFERTGLPALMRQLLKGDFLAASGAERVIRQVSPAAVWFAGLHADGQLRPAALRGLRSTRELTLWTPFQDCTTEMIPRLLLLHRGEHYKDLFTDADQTSVNGIAYLPIQLKPVDQPGEGMHTVEAMFQRVFEARRWYAPPVPLGSSVLFDHDVIHGSYLRERMADSRYSLDCRMIAEFAPSKVTQSYSGRVFSAKTLFQPRSLTQRVVSLLKKLR